MKLFSIVSTLFICAILCGCGKSGSTGIVIVGMEQSAKFGKCEGCSHDAATMNRILSKYGKPTVLQNQQATKAAVVDALQKASQKDLMIFFYSGHGGSDRIGDVSGEPDRRNEYLCLYNTYMLDNEIWEIVKRAKGRVFLIFDCCHSETMFRSPGIDLSGMAEEMEMARSGDKVNMLCWSGCPDDNYSYGGTMGGVLTNAIRDSYGKWKSYDKVWAGAKLKARSQNPRKTQIGKGFDGRVFK